MTEIWENCRFISDFELLWRKDENLRISIHCQSTFLRLVSDNTYFKLNAIRQKFLCLFKLLAFGDGRETPCLASDNLN